MLLTKKQILDADDIKYVVVPVPEWGGDVRVKSLTGAERSDFESQVFEQRGEDVKANFKNYQVKLLVLAIVDEEGNQIFSESDVDILSVKSASAISRVFSAAQKLSGLRKEDIDDLTKKSSETLPVDSISD